MKTSLSITLDLVFCLWSTQIPTQTVPSFSCGQWRPLCWIVFVFVFGIVVEGFDVLEKMESYGSNMGPTKPEDFDCRLWPAVNDVSYPAKHVV